MVQAEVEWTEEALGQLAAIHAYIERNDPGAADRVARRLKAAAEALSDFPNRGRPGKEGARELPTVAPYIIEYRVSGKQVFIRRIRHGRQLPPED
jgi:plasmid stabilization system protein ParE